MISGDFDALCKRVDGGKPTDEIRLCMADALATHYMLMIRENMPHDSEIMAHAMLGWDNLGATKEQTTDRMKMIARLVGLTATIRENRT